MAFAIAACRIQPDADELLNDMVVVTNYNETVNFDNFMTYAMPMDSIGLITNEASLKWITDDYASLVTNAMRNNMSSTGRTKVDKDQSPSLSVNVYVVKDVQAFQSVVYPNYYGYPGAGYGNYYGYPGYYNYPQVVTYQSQSAIMIIEFVDLLNIDPVSGEARVIWTAHIGDLINSFDPEDKVVEAIDQAFAQSDYLKP